MRNYVAETFPRWRGLRRDGLADRARRGRCVQCSRLVMQMLIIVLLVGRPVSLIFSWAYELTPDGLMKAHEVPADALKDPRAVREFCVN